MAAAIPFALRTGALLFDPTGKYRVTYSGAFAAIEATVSSGDGVKAEFGAMVKMTNNLLLHGKMEGGAAGYYMTHFCVAPGSTDRGEVLLAPCHPGEVIMISLNGHTAWSIMCRSFLAADDHVATGSSVLEYTESEDCCCGGGSYTYVLEAKGPGRLLVSTYGSIARFDLQPGEELVIGKQYLVAWTSATKYQRLTRAPESTFSQGGLACQFTGPGTIYLQTRSINGLASGIIPYVPTADPAATVKPVSRQVAQSAAQPAPQQEEPPT